MVIRGGYILQPRSIDESEVSKFPPHVREIWSYLLRKANHADIISSGKTIKRGQLFTSYSEILEALSWKVGYRKESYKKHHCETAMKLLVKATMITTTKTTRGIIITICKYDYYQNPKNYETDSENCNETEYETATKCATINKNEKNDNNIIHIGGQDFFVFGSYSEVMNEMLSDTIFLEQAICMNMKISLADAEDWVKKFFVKLTSEGNETVTSLSDARQYFSNWLRFELDKQLKQEKGGNNGTERRKGIDNKSVNQSPEKTSPDYSERFI